MRRATTEGVQRPSHGPGEVWTVDFTRTFTKSIEGETVGLLWMDVTSGLLRGSVHDHTDIAAAAAELTLFVASESPRRDTRLRQIWMDSDPNAVRNTDLLRSMTALERWGLANGVKATRSVLHLINTTQPHHFLVNKAYVKMPFPRPAQWRRHCKVKLVDSDPNFVKS